MSLLRLLAVSLLVAATFGCDPGSPAQTDPRVFVVEATPGVDVTVTPDRLVFQLAGHEDLLARQPGDILVCSHGAGFIRGVASVTSADATIDVMTTPAELGDAIIDGTTSDSSDLDDLQGQWKMDGKWDGVLPFDGLLEIGDTTILGNGDVTVSLKDVHLSFKPTVSLDLDIRGRRVTYFKAVAQGTLATGMTVAVTTTGNVAVREEKELWKSTPKTFVQWVGPVPVVEVVQLSFGVGVEVDAEGAAATEVGGNVTGSLTAGATYDYYDGGWQAVGERSLSVVPVAQLTEGDADLAFSLYLYGQLDVMFYDVAGPFIYVAPYVGVSHTVGEPGWSRSLGVYGAWGGQVEIFGENVAGFEAELFDFSKDF
jgi:hypothetical protein